MPHSPVTDDGKNNVVRFSNNIEIDTYAERIKVKVMEAVGQSLDGAVLDSLRRYIDTIAPSGNGCAVQSIDSQFRSPDSRDNGQGKLFISRDSLLTQLFESDHIKTIYYIFIAVLLIFMMNSFVNDFINYSMLDLRFDLIRWCFGGFSVVIYLWMVMFSSALFAYVAFNFWVTHDSRRFLGNLGIYVWFCVYVAFLTAFCVLPVYYVIVYDLPIASCFIIGCEQLRLIMKVHSFVRENAVKVLNKTSAKHKKDDDSDYDIPNNGPSGICPPFEHYLYFLFAPTLIYRDHYPRTGTISWRYVTLCFGQVLACIFYCYYIFAHFCVPVFQNFNAEHLTLKTFVRSWFCCVLPGALCLFLGFFALLHSWMNGFAEMLRFADRMFYKDWWNSTTFANYYRTWNLIVHDWLYTYIYRDCCQFLGIRNRNVVLLIVFLLSALMHEYVLMLAFKFFYPVMFVEFFVFGVLIMFVTQKRRHRSWNILLWVSLFMGCGLMICLYSTEWYARKNCVETDKYWLMPRSWCCKHYKTSAN